MKLKQGFYNYKYVVVNDSNELEEGAISGDFYETENNYKVLSIIEIWAHDTTEL